MDTDDPVEVGGETSYIINVRNQGQVPVTNLTVIADVPAQMAVVRVTGPSDHAKDSQRSRDPERIPRDVRPQLLDEGFARQPRRLRLAAERQEASAANGHGAREDHEEPARRRLHVDVGLAAEAFGVVLHRLHDAGHVLELGYRREQDVGGLRCEAPAGS